MFLPFLSSYSIVSQDRVFFLSLSHIIVTVTVSVTVREKQTN